MNNFEKFKQDLTVEKLAEMIATAYCVDACEYCNYGRHTCDANCEHGIKKWLESEAGI